MACILINYEKSQHSKSDIMLNKFHNEIEIEKNHSIGILKYTSASCRQVKREKEQHRIAAGYLQTLLVERCLGWICLFI